MGFLAGAQAKMYAIGAVIFAFGLMLLRMKMLEVQRDNARRKAKIFEAQRDQERSNATIDKDLRKERKDANKKARQDIRAGKVPDALGADLNDFD